MAHTPPPTHPPSPLPPAHPRQCKRHGVSKCFAHPTRLFRVKCTRCDYARDYSPTGAGSSKYLYYRRRTRASLGLLSVGAPLDPASAAFLCRAASECGIISNTSQPHVAFVEGLVPEVDHGGGIRELRLALSYDPTLTVVSVHRVPRRDNVTDLILADVVLSPGADGAARHLSGDPNACALPQFPFHVALGACPRAGGGSKRATAWAEAILRGATMAVDPRRVRVLPPPEGGPNGRKGRAQQQHPRGHRRQQQLAQPQQQELGWRQGQKRQKGQKQEQISRHRQPRREERPLCGPCDAEEGSPYGTYVACPSGKPDKALSDLTDDTDSASTSGLSSASEAEEQEHQLPPLTQTPSCAYADAAPFADAGEQHFPGLAVDLTFLDEQDESPEPVAQRAQVAANPWQVSPPVALPASIW